MRGGMFDLEYGRVWERASLFLLGGGAYVCAELAWRGESHWTMFLAGGACFCVLEGIGRRQAAPLPASAALAALLVTGVELLVGLGCRTVLHRNVWDYSGEWGNVAGLICPKYTALWFLLCLFLLWAMRQVRQALRRGAAKGEKYGLWPRNCRDRV